MSVGFLPRVSEDGSTLSSADVYVFGPFVLDVTRHVLTRDSRPVPLTPKAFELLLILARSGGRVLSRQELVTALWPDTFVEEGNLSFQMSVLRKALGDAPAVPLAKADGPETWIETVPKVGYRFTADVSVRQAAVRDRPRLTKRTWVLAAASVSIAGLVLWAVAPSTTPRHGSSYGTSAVPLTAYPGWEGSPRLSPDGTQVAFSWDGPEGGDFNVYVKLVGDGEPLRLTDDRRHEVAPSWSPDGHRLAFLRIALDGSPWDLMVMPSLGGTDGASCRCGRSGRPSTTAARTGCRGHPMAGGWQSAPTSMERRASGSWKSTDPVGGSSRTCRHGAPTDRRRCRQTADVWHSSGPGRSRAPRCSSCPWGLTSIRSGLHDRWSIRHLATSARWHGEPTRRRSCMPSAATWGCRDWNSCGWSPTG